MIKVAVILMSLSLVLPSFAETIVTKSGQTIEGKLIEKTDKYIKIDFEGVPLTYFFDEVESIDGEKVTFTLPETVVSFQDEPAPYQGKEATTQSKEVLKGGEWHSQKEGLFRIFVPNEWQCIENADNFKITDIEGKNAIQIGFRQMQQKINDDSIKFAMKFPITLLRASIINEDKINFKGREAWKMNFTLASLGPDLPFTCIAFAKEGYLISVTFGGVNREERLKEEKIIETLQF